jgi:hypothetical protein
MKKHLAALLVLLMLAGAGVYIADVADAATDTNLMPTHGLTTVVSMYEDGAITSYADDGTHGLVGKRCIIHTAQITTQSNAIWIMTRIQQSPNGVYIDLVPATSIAELTTAVAAFNFSGIGHPAPQADACDDAVITAATP